MKALAVSRNSWIYKLAKFGGFEESWSGSTSICELNTAIMCGVSRILGFALVIAFFGFFMLTPVYYGVLYFIDPANNIIASVEAFVIGLVLDAIAFIATCLFFYTESDYYYSKLHRESDYTEPSKIALHWQAFKDKVCIKVNFE